MAAALNWDYDPEKFKAPPGYTHPERRQRIIKSFDRLAKPYGLTSNGQIAEVVKALGTQSLGGLFGDATPLRLENLDGVMTNVLFKKPHLKMFNSLPRVPAAQIIFQWLEKLDYGTQRGNRGFREGGVPQTGTSKWRRGTSTVRYLGVRRGYTHQMITVGQMGGSYIDPVTSENIDGTLELLGGLERDIIFGDASIPDNAGNAVMYDGLYNQLAGSANSVGFPTNVIDMQGAPVDFEDLENLALNFVVQGKLQTFENIRTMWTPFVLSDFAKLRYQAERILLPNAAPGYRPGTPIEGFRTQHGYFPFEETIFLNPVENGAIQVDQNNNPIADANSPAAPVITSSTPSGTGGLIPGGTYFYFVTAINDAGESLPTASGAVVVPAGNTGSVVIIIAATANATGYRIYRGTVNTASDPSVGWVGTVCAGFPLTPPTVLGTVGSGATFTDANQWIPGTGVGILGNFAEEDMAIAQLAPLIKFPLAVVNTTQEFLLILYHVPITKTPKRLVIIKNVGRRT